MVQTGAKPKLVLLSKMCLIGVLLSHKGLVLPGLSLEGMNLNVIGKGGIDYNIIAS